MKKTFLVISFFLTFTCCAMRGFTQLVNMITAKIINAPHNAPQEDEEGEEWQEEMVAYEPFEPLQESPNQPRHAPQDSTNNENPPNS